MESIVSFLNSILWGPWFIYGILLIGLFFSIITRFLQIRHIKDMFVLMFKGEKSEKGISSFQAMSIALSGRVGTGNIAGTATAIAMGDLVLFFGCGQLPSSVQRQLMWSQH